MSSPRKSLEFLSFHKVSLVLDCVALGLKQKRLPVVRRKGLLDLQRIYFRHRLEVWPEKCKREGKGKEEKK